MASLATSEKNKMLTKYRSDGKLAPILVEPIYDRQPEESDREHRFFLVYRDIPWEDRSLKKATSIILGAPSDSPSNMVADFSSRWQWEKRADAWDLFVQEGLSTRNERIVQETKTEIEMLAYKIVKRIRGLNTIMDEKEIDQILFIRELALIEGIVGKGNAGKWMLDAYKTIVGEKLQVSGKINHLVWGN